MFKDVEENRWSRRLIERAARLGIIKGYEDGTFKPKQNLTREEAAVIAVLIIDGWADVAKRTVPSVLQLETSAGQGSGTIIHPSGLVLTNHHVINGADNVVFRSMDKLGMGTTYAEGKVLASDPVKDLAICQIGLSIPMKAVPLAKSIPDISEEVIAIGSPRGLTQSVTHGVVSAHRSQKGVNYIQTETEISPGNSGGALINREGFLVGVPTWKVAETATEGLAFCVDVSTIKQFIMENINSLPEKVVEVL